MGFSAILMTLNSWDLMLLMLLQQIDLREDSTIRLTAVAPYPVITFGPFGSPTEVLVSLSHAIGFSQNPSFNSHCVVLQIAFFRIIMYRKFVCSAFYFPCSLYWQCAFAWKALAWFAFIFLFTYAAYLFWINHVPYKPDWWLNSLLILVLVLFVCEVKLINPQ